MYIKKILWAIALIGIVVCGVVSFYIYTTMFSPNTNFNNPYAYIYISNNDAYADVRTQLEPLLKDIHSFDALAKQKKYKTNIKPGKYSIARGMGNNAIINSIRSVNIPVKLSFNNQNSLAHLAGRVSQQIDADSLSILNAMQNPSFLEATGFNSETALGMYLPNSYEVFWNLSAERFVKRMHKEYKRFWTAARQKKASALKLSETEIMTLASIVYEESKQKSEQPRVAGVYLNRLRVGMPLQADPTIKFAAYQLPQYQNTVIKRVLNVHKTIDSPYNTYLYTGLPPGPIAMPDLSAIDAVLHYEPHDYFYFVADAKRMGYHKFAKTLRQHNINAANYHKYLNTQGIVR